ncbi:tRNA pseudouridine(55) synthase TruB [Thiovibrio frasassiensis]|uniref:tRNA pseudouridine synthase B n=1 Tax=Thiovibrio frasassiensis TaxID=2984131 RepID=A0A9X4MES5_9BACT|nr:tRNA pseudouridine(55) synthase TruB [Thiovibrio frasassiensis]MDG4474880.1 tRNA pseudouridine(55) synthase TruB [Thiovibrio frasassiensis]
MPAKAHDALAGKKIPAEPALAAGIFLVDKPVGPSSFRMVQLVRRALSIKKVGHAGTLDPFASGLLIICVGRPATRLISQFMDGNKWYEAVLKLGIETTTQDLEGEVVAQHVVPPLSREELEHCLSGFLGAQLQTPPQYSALKHMGKPLYHYARRGIIIEKAPRPITIFRLELLAAGADTVRILVECSKGTYIRTLAADIGGSLGCGAHLVALRRLQSGSFTVDSAVDGSLLQDPLAARDLLLAKALSVEEVEAMLAGNG